MKRLAIDIGSYNIKLLESEDRRGRHVITNIAVRKVFRKDLKSEFKDFIAGLRPSPKKANTSISGPSVIIRYVDMPRMKEEELKSAMKFEAEKYIPFDINESIIDCASAGAINPATQKVFLVAAKKNAISFLLDIFKEAGLGVRVIDVDCFALFNAFESYKGRDKGILCGLLDIGASVSNMVILADGRPSFSRDILWGGEDLTIRIAEVLGLNSVESEMLKKKPDARLKEVNDAIYPALDKLVAQIRMSLDYFEAHYGRSVREIYISGGCSYLPGINEMLKSRLGLEIYSWNPLEGMEAAEGISKELLERGAMFAVARGLLLRT